MKKFLWKEFVVVFATNVMIVFYANKLIDIEFRLSPVTCSILAVCASIFCYALVGKYLKKE